MAAARVASNHSSPISSSQSLDGSSSRDSHKSLSPLNVPAITANAVLNGVPSPNGVVANLPNGNASNAAQATFTREEVMQLLQTTILNMHRDQALRAQQAQAQSRRDISPESFVMKPRVHLFEFHPHRNAQAQTCTDRRMVATLELPGLTKADIAITARPNGELLITGERKPLHLQPSYLEYISTSHGLRPNQKNEEISSTGRMVFNELKFGRFQRTLRLPESTDPTRITASMDDGMLSICWPLPCTGPSQSNDLPHPELSVPSVRQTDVEQRLRDVHVE